MIALLALALMPSGVVVIVATALDVVDSPGRFHEPASWNDC